MSTLVKELSMPSRRPVKTTSVRQLLELIQVLCARGESLDDIWATAEQAIQKLDSRH
jgi:hypothetical protein